MKQSFMMVAIAATLFSCQTRDNRTYEGILPAADGPGIRYTLQIDNAPSSEQGKYELTIVYLDAEDPTSSTYTSQGKKELIQREADRHPQTICKLTPDSGEPALYFRVVNDTTLRLLNSNLQESDSGLNYDLTLIRH